MNLAKRSGNVSRIKSSGRSKSKRLLLSQHHHRLFECGQMEDLSEVLLDQAETCRNIEVPVCLILIEVDNFDEIKSDSFQTPTETVNEVAQNLVSVVREQDLIVQYGARFLAILLVDANQDVGAKVCQRIKEAVHKFSYFHVCTSALQLSFGLSDDTASHYQELDTLILSANKALEAARDRGEGAIVRASDFDPMKEFRDREHFFPGDRLSSMSD